MSATNCPAAAPLDSPNRQRSAGCLVVPVSTTLTAPRDVGSCSTLQPVSEPPSNSGSDVVATLTAGPPETPSVGAIRT